MPFHFMLDAGLDYYAYVFEDENRRDEEEAKAKVVVAKLKEKVEEESPELKQGICGEDETDLDLLDSKYAEFIDIKDVWGGPAPSEVDDNSSKADSSCFGEGAVGWR